MKNSQRKVVVLTSLVGVLALTSALLRFLAPPPLLAETTSRSTADTDLLEDVFKTSESAKPGRWKFIYIHQSLTTAGNALNIDQAGGELGDHFLVGNGDGCQDGEIQIGQRWNRQSKAAPPPGTDQIDPDCISICLVGDYDHDLPTSTQLRQLAQLVHTLQGRLQIPADKVVFLHQPGSASSIGANFPSTAFRQELLP